MTVFKRVLRLTLWLLTALVIGYMFYTAGKI